MLCITKYFESYNNLACSALDVHVYDYMDAGSNHNDLLTTYRAKQTGKKVLCTECNLFYPETDWTAWDIATVKNIIMQSYFITGTTNYHPAWSWKDTWGLLNQNGFAPIWGWLMERPKSIEASLDRYCIE